MFSQTNVSSLRIKEQLLVDSGSFRDTLLEIHFSLDTTRRRRRKSFRNKLANFMIPASSPFALLSCKRSFRDTLPLEEMDRNPSVKDDDVKLYRTVTKFKRELQYTIL